MLYPSTITNPGGLCLMQDVRVGRSDEWSPVHREEPGHAILRKHLQGSLCFSMRGG